MKRLDPTLDVVFKRLLTREPELLRHMLEGILGRAVRSVTVIDPDIPGDRVGDKRVVFDVRATLDDGSRVDVEMQRVAPVALRSRLFFYGARDYVDQLSCGDDYHRLTSTVVIVWLLQPLFPTLRQLHLAFGMHEHRTCTPYGDQLSIHVLQLGAPPTPDARGYDAVTERWARFFARFDDDAELDRLAAEDPMMALAKQTLDQLSQDPEARRQAREREEAIKLYEIDLEATREDAMARGWADGRAAGRAEGMMAGRAEGMMAGRAEGMMAGRAAILLQLLDLRFGPLSEAIRAQLEAATPEQLDVWAARVLTATSLGEVLDHSS